MDIVIVGSSGQLGKDCCSILSREHTIHAPSESELDIGDESSVLSCLSAARPDVVINCAAYTAVDRCEEERRQCRRINSEGPRYLARACYMTESRLIHISTDYVFDGKKPAPEGYSENDPVNPLSHYGRTKLDGEKGVTEQGGNHLIIRTAWLYSAHGHNFLRTMLRLNLESPGTQRTVVNDQFGSPTWSFTLARQIKKLLGPETSGVVHATSEGYATWYEVACYFLDRMGLPHTIVPCTTKDYPTPAHRPANSILCNDVLNGGGLSVFRDWKSEIDLFVENHGKELLRQVSLGI